MKKVYVGVFLQKSPIMGSGMRLGVWVSPVRMRQSAFFILRQHDWDKN